MGDLDDFYVHQVQVETYESTNGYGADQFAAAKIVPGFLNDSQKVVRGSDGAQIVSSTQFYCDPQYAADFAPQSRVTLPNGIVARVIIASANTSGPLDLPDHLAVSLV